MISIWLTIGTAALLAWTIIDIRHSMRNHKARIGFAAWHWFARLPCAVVIFGLLWPIGVGMAIHGHRAAGRMLKKQDGKAAEPPTGGDRKSAQQPRRSAASRLMAMRELLQGSQRDLGFIYPPSFVHGIEELADLLGSEGFRRAFSDTRLLLSTAEIEAERKSMPCKLIPFMCEDQPSWPDIYAFDGDGHREEVRVVVWSDHAIVMEWENYPIFIQWVREQVARKTTPTDQEQA